MGAGVGSFVQPVTSAPSPWTANPAKGGAEGSWVVEAVSVP